VPSVDRHERNPQGSIRCETSRLVVGVIGALNALNPSTRFSRLGTALSAGRDLTSALHSALAPPSAPLSSLFVPEFSWNAVFVAADRSSSVVCILERGQKERERERTVIQGDTEGGNVARESVKISRPSEGRVSRVSKREKSNDVAERTILESSIPLFSLLRSDTLSIYLSLSLSLSLSRSLARWRGALVRPICPMVYLSPPSCFRLPVPRADPPLAFPHLARSGNRRTIRPRLGRRQLARESSRQAACCASTRVDPPRLSGIGGMISELSFPVFRGTEGGGRTGRAGRGGPLKSRARSR